MFSPYLWNIIGLVFEIIGVVYLVSYTIMIRDNNTLFIRALKIASNQIESGGNPTGYIEKLSTKVGVYFILGGLLCQIYANYLQM